MHAQRLMRRVATSAEQGLLLQGTVEVCRILHEDMRLPYDKWPARLRNVCEEGCELSHMFFLQKFQHIFLK